MVPPFRYIVVTETFRPKMLNAKQENRPKYFEQLGDEPMYRVRNGRCKYYTDMGDLDRAEKYLLFAISLLE